jgi:Carboxypeptidase regulatory-like domain
MSPYFSKHTSAQRMPIFVVVCLAAIFLLTSLTPSLFGQTAATGALTGTLRDSSGAVVPNATVTSTSLGTAQVRTTTTTDDGTYKFGLLPPGAYTLKFEAAGFNSVEVPSVTVVVTETAVLDEALQVGAQTQQVEVRAQTEAVQTASSTVGNVVSAQTITAMPLTSRNYTNLLGLAAGANANVFNAANLGRGSQDIAVNGATVAQNNYSMDGASIVNFTTNGNTADGGSNPGIGIVNPDAIEEFKIQTSMFDAGYGRKPGANVNVVTKSGTNQFHGTAFEFFRNTALNANDFFRKVSPPVGGVATNGRQALNQNQFGGVFGGPIKKDKLFFFVSYQETQQKNGISPAGYSTPTLVGIPQTDRSNTAAFKAALGAAFCGSKTQLGGTQVACNGSNVNQVALNLLQLKNPDGSYYIPGSSTGANQNVTFSLPATYKEHQAIGNFDYVLNSANTLSGRWNYSGDRTNATMDCAATGSTISQCLPGNPAQVFFSTQYAVLKLTSTLSPNLVNEVRGSMQRNIVGPENEVPFTNSQVGIAPLVPSINTLDTITVSGLMAFGGRGNLGTLMWDTSMEASDQLSWSHGKHTFRAGFEFERDRENWDFFGVAIGALTFQTFPDFLLGLPGCGPGTGTTATLTTPATGACLASQLAGTTNGTSASNISSSGTTVSATPPGGVIHGYRIAAASAFVQDDFKVRSNLTLNLGLRWEYDGLVSDNHGLLTNVWPNLITTVNKPLSQGGTLGTSAATGSLAGFVVPANFNFGAFPPPPVGGVFQNDQTIVTANSPSIKNYSPRVGFAWKPFASDRFVVRGGGGFFYDRVGVTTYNKSTQTSIPYAVPSQQSGAANYFSSFSQPFAPVTVGWTPRWINFTPPPGTNNSSNLNVILTDPNYPTPLTYQWNMNVQYEFAPSWVLEVGYVGSRSIHQAPDNTVAQVLEHQINEAQLASPANPVNGITNNSTSNASLRVPYLGFAPAGLGADQAISDSKYNSLQTTVRKQLSRGLTLQAAYSYSRGVTTTSYITFNDPDLPLQYGLTPFIHPHRFTVNYSYDLPFGVHEGLFGKLASGWNLSGVTVAQDGMALTPTDTRGGTAYGFGAGSVTSTAFFAPGMSNANVPSSGDLKQRLGGALGGQGYFNKAAFVTTALPVIGAGSGGTGGTGYGNAGYGILLGPGQFNWDMTLQKTTKVGGIHEDATLVFRTEFFNAFNHAQFNNPGVVDVSKANVGQITSSSVNPRLIQFALKYVF